MSSIKINTVNDLINIVYATKKRFPGDHLWWRGHGNLDWELAPQVFNRGFSEKEHNMNVLFQSRAKVRHAECPDQQDLQSWLYLMHRCGLPTRLLNWSESILVATYFAVASKQDWEIDGAVWGLEPSKLNETQIDRPGVMVHHDDQVHQLFSDAFVRDGGEVSPKIVALWTDQRDLKQVVQFSTYTIHGTPVPMNNLRDSADYLVKFEIPAMAKPQLHQALELLAIRKSSLFPDLEHLAHELQSIQFV